MPEYSVPVPSKSQQAFWAQKDKAHQNAGLIFERFAPDTRDDAKLKEKGLQAAQDASQKADKDLLTAWNDRWQGQTRDALTFSLQTDWRLIAGLGKKGSLEVGFTFHRYGFPYLPGSSLKGLARAAALLEIGEKLNIDILEILRKKVIETDKPKEPEKFGLLKALEIVLSREEEACLKELNACQNPSSDAVTALAKTFRAVFGTTEHGGHVVFFDAIPSARVLPTLELDIMNPHYPDYYKETGQGNPQTTPPANWQSPIPVKFLTVAPGTEFRFAVGWRKSPVDSTPIEALPTEKAQKEWRWFKGVVPASPVKESPNPLLKQARQWLEEGLRDLGVGGKTNAGYGYFSSAGAQVTAPTRAAQQPPALPTGYERGVVKAFGLGDKQSFGFITRSNGADLFVHKNNLAAGLMELQPGQKVIFKTGPGPRGPQAMDVELDE